MRIHLFICAAVIACGVRDTGFAQEAGTAVSATHVTGSVTSHTPYPGYTIHSITAGGTVSFQVDANEPENAHCSMSVKIKDPDGSVIATDIGSGYPLSPGQSATQTVSGLSTQVMASGTYTIEVVGIMYGMTTGWYQFHTKVKTVVVP